MIPLKLQEPTFNGILVFKIMKIKKKKNTAE